MDEDFDIQAGGVGLSIDEITRLYGRWIKAGPSIIVIGPDGVGKTTIVSHLANMTGAPSFKCPTEKDIFFAGGRSSLVFDHMLTHFLEQTGYRFISDRGYPCEWVYSWVFDRETDAKLLGQIDVAHSKLGTKILYLYSSIRPTQEDDIVPMDKYEVVREHYDMFCDDWTDCEVTKIDTADMLLAYRVGLDDSRRFAEKALDKMGLKK